MTKAFDELDMESGDRITLPGVNRLRSPGSSPLAWEAGLREIEDFYRTFTDSPKPMKQALAAALKETPAVASADKCQENSVLNVNEFATLMKDVKEVWEADDQRHASAIGTATANLSEPGLPPEAATESMSTQSVGNSTKPGSVSPSEHQSEQQEGSIVKPLKDALEQEQIVSEAHDCSLGDLPRSTPSSDLRCSTRKNTLQLETAKLPQTPNVTQLMEGLQPQRRDKCIVDMQAPMQDTDVLSCSGISSLIAEMRTEEHPVPSPLILSPFPYRRLQQASSVTLFPDTERRSADDTLCHSDDDSVAYAEPGFGSPGHSATSRVQSMLNAAKAAKSAKQTSQAGSSNRMSNVEVDQSVVQADGAADSSSDVLAGALTERKISFERERPTAQNQRPKSIERPEVRSPPKKRKRQQSEEEPKSLFTDLTEKLDQAPQSRPEVVLPDSQVTSIAKSKQPQTRQRRKKDTVPTSSQVIKVKKLNQAESSHGLKGQRNPIGRREFQQMIQGKFDKITRPGGPKTRLQKQAKADAEPNPSAAARRRHSKK